MARILLAGLLAGVVVFVWGAVAHMALPLGMVDFHIPPDAKQQAALDGLSGQFDTAGIYMLPMPQQELWKDDAAMAAFGAAAEQKPYAFVVYQPRGRDGMKMGPLLGTQLATTVLCGLLAAWIAAGTVGGRGKRIAVVTALGVFAAIAVCLPNWNWYRFPTDYTVAAFVEHAVGWLLGGIAIAFVLKPRPA